MAKYKIDDTVKFFLTENIKSDSAVISALVEKISDKMEQQYIIKHTVGWKPTQALIEKYSLVANLRYVFVEEKQITAIP